MSRKRRFSRLYRDFSFFSTPFPDHRTGETGRDLPHRNPLAERLLHPGIHEDGAACPEIEGFVRLAGDPGEIGYGIVEGAGEGLDEGAAARRAGLIDLDIGDAATPMPAAWRRHNLHFGCVHDKGFRVMASTAAAPRSAAVAGKSSATRLRLNKEWQPCGKCSSGRPSAS
jgi:hypothetical protein